MPSCLQLDFIPMHKILHFIGFKNRIFFKHGAALTSLMFWMVMGCLSLQMNAVLVLYNEVIIFLVSLLKYS